MDVLVLSIHTHLGFCSFEHLIRDSANKGRFRTRVRANFGRDPNDAIFIQSVGGIVCVKPKWCFRNQANSNGRLLLTFASSSNPPFFRFIRNRHLDEGFRVFEDMVFRGAIPASWMCDRLVEEYCQLCLIDKAAYVLKIFEDCGGVPYLRTCITLLEAMCREVGVWQAMQCLCEMVGKGRKLNAHAFNVVIAGFCENERWDTAVGLLSYMSKQGCPPNVVTFNILIAAFIRSGLCDRAISILEEMHAYGCTPRNSTYNAVLHELCTRSETACAVEYLQVMISRGYHPDIATWNVFLEALCREQMVEAADVVLHQMGCPPVTSSYNTVITGLTKTGKTERGIELLEEMLKSGIDPDAFTYAALLGGLCREGAGDEALTVVCRLEDWGMGYSRAIIIYQDVILGLCDAREIDSAIDVLVDVILRGYRQIESMCTIVIEGMVDGGLVMEAKGLFGDLSRKNVNSKSWTKHTTNMFRSLKRAKAVNRLR